jgi:predicted short-subunit dehydrogenase-like oxidoreductase (DUF2520 family)
MNDTIHIVGGGRVGRTLGRLLRRAGFSIGAVRCRSMASARRAVRFIGGGRSQGVVDGGLVFVTVPDDAIAAAVAVLPGVRVHCAGGLDARSVGAEGSFHPLRSFADPGLAARSFAGTPIAVEGAVVTRLERIARAIGGVPFRVRGKAAYHAGAVFASNYLVACFEAAVRLLVRAGLPRRGAAQILLPLAAGTVANLQKLGSPRALTGPVERGDAATVARHLRAAGALAPLYASLGRLTVEIARAKGSIDARVARRLDAILRKG